MCFVCVCMCACMDVCISVFVHVFVCAWGGYDRLWGAVCAHTRMRVGAICGGWTGTGRQGGRPGELGSEDSGVPPAGLGLKPRNQ